MTKYENNFDRRKQRVRSKLKLSNKKDYLRLSIHKTCNYIYLQLIDDQSSKTLLSASTNQKTLKSELKRTNNILSAEKLATNFVDKYKADKTLEGKKAIFDKGGYIYHGVVSKVAEVLRTEGILI